MPIGNRHVRHDWQTFVDWRQKSVKTMCGVKTRSELAGIPGVTEQPTVLKTIDKDIYGWCIACCYETCLYAEAALSKDLHPYIRAMYEGTAEIVRPGHYLRASMLSRQSRDEVVS